MFSSTSLITSSRLLRASKVVRNRARNTCYPSGASSIQSHQHEHRVQYVSRAHPRPVPEFPVGQALQMVMDGIEERKVNRAKKWDRNAPKRQSKGLKDDGPPQSRRNSRIGNQSQYRSASSRPSPSRSHGITTWYWQAN